MKGKIFFIFKDGHEKEYETMGKVRGLKLNHERPESFRLEVEAQSMGVVECRRFTKWIATCVIPALAP